MKKNIYIVISCYASQKMNEREIIIIFVYFMKTFKGMGCIHTVDPKYWRKLKRWLYMHLQELGFGSY